MSQGVSLLSDELGRAVPSRFFAPLAGEGRALAVDLLASLAEGFTQSRRSIPRSEAIDVIREALVAHPALVPPPDKALAREWPDPGFRANYYFSQFAEAGWVMEDDHRYSLRKRTVVLDSNARALLALIRELAITSFKGTARFSDTFRSVIDSVLSVNQPPFGPDDDHPYSTLRDLADRCAKGTLVLRRIENLLRRFTHEQTRTVSRRRNLELVVVELQGLTRTQYFRELNNPHLFRRCDDAAARLEQLTFEHELLRRMAQECFEREEAKTAEAAELLVLDELRSLTDVLKGLRDEARQIELWATRFLSASLAKFRHLQSIPPRQVEAANVRLAEIARDLAGKKWWLFFPTDRIPPVRLPELGFVWGTSSLWLPRDAGGLAPPAPVKRPARNGHQKTLEQLKAARRKSITLRRACAFVERTLPKAGDRIDSEKLMITDLETLLDVLSCLCYAQGRRANYRIHRPIKRPATRYAKTGDWYLERFTLERTQ
jgi:hypothetical protein